MTEKRHEITPEQRAFAENALHTLPFSRLIGMRLEDLQPDLATISIDMRDDLRQPSGVLHGGVTATLIDTAMAFAVRTRIGLTEATATIDLTVHYLRPHMTGKFICTAKVVRAGKRIFTVSADVHGSEGKLIATGLSTYTRV
ncbi:MAG: PaaI family thioesterase [Acidobacteria bacterium]|nr:PaaI family thioesterase [Acidobacteriota bacterium]MBK9527889.1 PaaI family thioesterase [Acidobacteriota bacterium]MBP7473999.1 PaaI family thioesterase [Pyrinomonadaceae bacterium]MBP9108573.1 PaaI family thioesterase [Pyrinomonadaceae bacterium]